MKLYHYSIIFVIVALIFITIQDISYAEMVTIKDERQILDSAFSNAVDMAVQNLVMDETNSILHCVPKAMESFYQTMFVSLNLTMDKEEQLRFQLYVPCIAVIDWDGLYLYYWIEENNKLTQKVSNRIPFSCISGSYVYDFNLGTTYKRTTIESGIAEELEITTDAILLLQKETICQIIERNLVDTVNQHNFIGKQYQLKYDFKLPTLDQSLFSQTIENPSMLIIFQGYPITGTGYTYEWCIFCGASRQKSKGYVVGTQEWYRLYHLPGCKKINDSNPLKYCKSIEECAKCGAYPCPYCVDVQQQYEFIP